MEAAGENASGGAKTEIGAKSESIHQGTQSSTCLSGTPLSPRAEQKDGGTKEVGTDAMEDKDKGTGEKQRNNLYNVLPSTRIGGLEDENEELRERLKQLEDRIPLMCDKLRFNPTDEDLLKGLDDITALVKNAGDEEGVRSRPARSSPKPSS